MSVDMTDILTAAVKLLAAAVGAFLLPWIRKKTEAADREKVIAWAKIFVAAAEQIFEENEKTEKKRYVVEMLEEKGYLFDPVEINTVIEAEVLRLHNELKGEKHGDAEK